MIKLSLKHKKGISIYSQLTRQLEYAIFTGMLKSGERLPSVRDLSKNLKINPLTVTKVYVFLEKKGLVVSHWGKGSFVKERENLEKEKRSRAHLQEMMDRFISEAIPLVKGPDDLLALFKQRLHGGQT